MHASITFPDVFNASRARLSEPQGWMSLRHRRDVNHILIPLACGVVVFTIGGASGRNRVIFMAMVSLSQLLMKTTRSALIVSASVVGMPCGKSL